MRIMNKPTKRIELNNGVLVEFYIQENRYFGDYHRLQINVVALIPLESAPPTDGLEEQTEKHSGFIKYEKKLERMGVATDQIDTAITSMMDDFIETVGCYLEKKNFAENLLRQKMKSQPVRNRFS